MVSLNDRYTLAPQMRVYDALGVRWVPFLMYFHPPDFHTKVLNTDRRGFRLTCLPSGEPLTWDMAAQDSCNLMVGASTVFGVGARHDCTTIPSRLTHRSGLPWLNFGGRAYNSTQEFLLFSMYRHHFKRIRRVLIFSGLGDLSLFFISPRYSPDFGPFFGMSQFLEAMNRLPLAKRVAREWRGLLAKFLHGKFIDNKSPRSLLKLFTGTPKTSGVNQTNADAYTPLTPDQAQGKDLLLQPLTRNLANWKLFADCLGARVDYVLQPFATWIDRSPSPEEIQLFAILDKAQGGHWPLLAKQLTREWYKWFAARLRDICAEVGISFFDLNEAFSRHCKRDEWLFVDRAHLTDIGSDISSEILLSEVLQ